MPEMRTCLKNFAAMPYWASRKPRFWAQYQTVRKKVSRKTIALAAFVSVRDWQKPNQSCLLRFFRGTVV